MVKLVVGGVDDRVELAHILLHLLDQHFHSLLLHIQRVHLSIPAVAQQQASVWVVQNLLRLSNHKVPLGHSHLQLSLVKFLKAVVSVCSDEGEEPLGQQAGVRSHSHEVKELLSELALGLYHHSEVIVDAAGSIVLKDLEPFLLIVNVFFINRLNLLGSASSEHHLLLRRLIQAN